MTFVKADPKQAFLKVGLYGPPGSGKTLTSLLLAEGLAARAKKRIAYVDTERGTDFYAMEVRERKVHPEAFDFDAMYTRSLAEVLAATKAIDATKYGVFIVDSISHIWDAAIEAYSGRKVGKNQDKIPMQAWAQIKKPYKELVRILLDAPLHVLILGRQKNIFEESDDDGMKKVGVGMRAEGETEYEPHICVRMESKKGEEAVYACVEKDRTGILTGKVIPNPSFSTFASILPLLGTVQAQSTDPEETAAQDSELLDTGKRDADKAAKSDTLWQDFMGQIGRAASLAELGAVATAIKKSKRHLLEDHENTLRQLYMSRHSELAGKAAPVEV